MRGSARIYDVRMAQFVLKIEKLSHIIGARESRDLRSPSPIMAPGYGVCLGGCFNCVYTFRVTFRGRHFSPNLLRS